MIVLWLAAGVLTQGGGVTPEPPVNPYGAGGGAGSGYTRYLDRNGNEVDAKTYFARVAKALPKSEWVAVKAVAKAIQNIDAIPIYEIDHVEVSRLSAEIQRLADLIPVLKSQIADTLRREAARLKLIAQDEADAEFLLLFA